MGEQSISLLFGTFGTKERDKLMKIIPIHRSLLICELFDDLQ